MTQRYHVVSLPDRSSALDPHRLAQVLAQDGQLLLPMLDLIENAQAAVDDLIDVMGRATIAAVLLISTAQSPAPSRKAKRPTATSPTTAPRPAVSPSRNASSKSPSPGCGRRPPSPMRRARSRSPPTRHMRKYASAS